MYAMRAAHYLMNRGRSVNKEETTMEMLRPHRLAANYEVFVRGLMEQFRSN